MNVYQELLERHLDGVQMRTAGLEPTQSKDYWFLKPMRIPISPRSLSPLPDLNQDLAGLQPGVLPLHQEKPIFQKLAEIPVRGVEPRFPG